MTSNPSFAQAAPKPTPDIKTRAELDQLKAQRPKPEPQMQLTPKGPDRASVDAQVRNKQASRLAEVKQTLNDRQRAVERNFAKSANTGRARAGFEQSR